MLGNPQLQGLKLENDFALTVDTQDGEERLGFFSGGQKVRLGFALRLELSRVLADFNGNEL